MTIERQQIEPCPFCGQSEYGLSFEDGSTFRWGLASCNGCGASIGEIRREYPDTGAWHNEAITEWNTRSGYQQQIDELEATIAQLQLDNAKMQSGITKVANELKAYQPLADAYSGAHIHNGWAKQLEYLTSQPTTTTTQQEQLNLDTYAFDQKDKLRNENDCC